MHLRHLRLHKPVVWTAGCVEYVVHVELIVCEPSVAQIRILDSAIAHRCGCIEQLSFIDCLNLLLPPLADRRAARSSSRFTRRTTCMDVRHFRLPS
jgi:hypothetical protein